MSVRRHDLVLSIYLHSRGFAFVLMEGPLSPFDWGVKEFRGKSQSQRVLVSVEALLLRFQPSVVVLQNMSGANLRSQRITDVNLCIAELAESSAVPVFSCSRLEVRNLFGAQGTMTRHSVAQTIVKSLPAFERYLPPRRKAWMSADDRMSLFDAAAFALVFYNRSQKNEN